MKPKWRVVCFTNLFNPEGLIYSIKLETELFWGIYSQLTWTCSDSVMDAFHWPAAEWTQVTAHSTTLKGTTSLESHNNNTAVSFKRLTLTWSAASSFYRLIPTSPTSCTEGSFNSKWKTLPKQTGIQRNVQESFRFSVRSNTSPRMVFNPQAAPRTQSAPLRTWSVIRVSVSPEASVSPGDSHTGRGFRRHAHSRSLSVSARLTFRWNQQ